MKKFLKKRLEKASADYYSGNPSMSDDELDLLVEGGLDDLFDMQDFQTYLDRS